MEYWDVFCEQGLRRPIHGFSFQINTGDAKLVCCKHHRYGPHESKVIEKLTDQLQRNGLIEDDDGLWGAIIMLAAKPHQEDVPWHKYKWRLCISYQWLNQVTHPFEFLIPWCNDAVEDINLDA